MEWRDCYASVHRMHILTASIETPAVQWMFRIRMAIAYHNSAEVRAYIESTKGWQYMLYSAVKYLRVAGIHNVNARNTRTLHLSDVRDWLKQDFLKSWSSRNGLDD